ncbi:hypothetical protein QW060_01755 [Myroides ceti]|uniref:Uncharacterized protein n=1 Tax=Paenimyroides ceti TaxID=395087 RepID=A0ABT8CQA8_9FLAO|nr:hypothetical protein [Paenimyroides ceti]MDN3705848.1 hypothetical protein [Paenimyroides ceti]
MPKILILLFILFFILVQVRNSYKLYKTRKSKNIWFYIDVVAIILTFVISSWVLYYFVF